MNDFVDFSRLSAPFSESIKGIIVHQSNVDLPSIAANLAGEATVTIAGAEAGDPVLACPHANLNNALTVTAFVSAANTVTVRAANSSAGAVNAASTKFTILVFRVGDVS